MITYVSHVYSQIITKVAQQVLRLTQQQEQRFNNQRTQLGGWRNSYYYYQRQLSQNTRVDATTNIDEPRRAA